MLSTRNFKVTMFREWVRHDSNLGLQDMFQVNDGIKVNRKLFYVYMLISRNRTRENTSSLSVRDVLEFYGHSVPSKSKKHFNEVMDILHLFEINNVIEIKPLHENISWNTYIQMIINTEYFDNLKNFVQISTKYLDAFKNLKTSLDKEAMLQVFLLVISGINYTTNEPCYYNMDFMAQTVHISSVSISKYINCLTEENDGNPPLLIKGQMSINQTMVSNNYSINPVYLDD